jgi:hypothetical protein
LRVFIQDFAVSRICNVWHTDCIASGTLLAALLMRVRIVKVPPASVLEGLDLRPFRLKPAETRNLRSPVANILVAWGYAQPIARRARARPTKTHKSRPKK